MFDVRNVEEGEIFLFIGPSRSGKTTAMLTQLLRLDSWVLWDWTGETQPYSEAYGAEFITDWNGLIDFFMRHPGGTDGRAIYFNGKKPDEYEKFCSAMLDWMKQRAGTGKQTGVGVTELQLVQKSTGKATDAANEIITGSMKWGGVGCWDAQRKQEIPETAWENARVVFISGQNIESAVRKLCGDSGLNGMQIPAKVKGVQEYTVLKTGGVGYVRVEFETPQGGGRTVPCLKKIPFLTMPWDQYWQSEKQKEEQRQEKRDQYFSQT